MSFSPQKEEKSAKTNQSVEKVFSIIELLAGKDGPMRLQDIAAELGLNSSTVLRFLATLMRCGYVIQDPDTLRYSLSYKICTLGNKVSAQISIRDVAHPFLMELSRIFGESVCLAVEQGMRVVYIDVVNGPDQMLRAMQRIGNAAPMHCTGVGKLMLLNATPEGLDHFIAEKGMERFTQNTIVTKEGLLQELEAARRDGYAFDNEECEIGARCIAAPIRDYSGKVVAGISITGPIFRITQELIETRKGILLDTAAEISKRLGWNPDEPAIQPNGPA